MVLADDMGLGKTVQVIGALNTDESINRVLIVCPKSLVGTWERELENWLVRDLRVGVAAAGADNPLGSEADIVIINYGAF